MKLLCADWPAPARVRAFTSTRLGGVSQAPYDSLNLGLHVGDDPAAVITNRARVVQQLTAGGEPQWLDQVHGTDVIEASANGEVVTADACWSDQRGQACAIMTADCLPVLFTDRQGTRVAAAHAGWRGLADGILENTLRCFPHPEAVLVWFGPAIGPTAFEVGDEVRQQFCAQLGAAEQAFVPSHNAGKWLANIYQLARLRLNAAGVTDVYGGDHCTFTQSDLFFSYRREGVTGRMASLIWIE